MAFRLNRRDVLKGAGTIAIGLPWLEAMRPDAHAAPPSLAQRFVAVYQPGGAVMNPASDPDDRRMSTGWRPSGSETDFTLSPILAPLEPVKDKLLVINGMNMESAVGEQHQAGICALLTGREQGGAGRYPSGPSLDQVIAPLASMGKPRASIEMAVRWATGKSSGSLNPINSMTFSTDQGNAAIPPLVDPQVIFDNLFGSLEPSEGGNERVERKLSILDYVDGRYETLAAKLGTSDSQKLDQHLTHLRSLETTLMGMPGAGNSLQCGAPMQVDTTGYNPNAGRNADLGNNGECPINECLSSDELIPTVGQFMMDMIVMAMACDLTGVVSFQWSDTEAKHTFPWLDLSPHEGQHHHYYQHDGGFRPVECAKICTWYSEQHAYLLQQMDAVDMGGHTLLDEAVVFFGSELSTPNTHEKDDMPFLLAGGGAGLRGNRWLQYNGQSHNDLLAGILNLFGDDSNTFGDSSHANGAVTNLT